MCMRVTKENKIFLKPAYNRNYYLCNTGKQYI